MKLARTLLLLPALAALSLASCTQSGSIGGGHTYSTLHTPQKYDPMSFGGHGGGYGNGYAIWPMPTDNYADYGWFDDPYSWGSGGYTPTRAPVRSYAPVATSEPRQYTK